MSDSLTSAAWRIFVASMIILQIIYVDVFFIEPNCIQVEHVRIVNARLARALEGVRVVQLSDLHLQNLGFIETSLIRVIERVRPDLIIVTGDVIESRQGMQAAIDIFSLFEPRFRTYIIAGEAVGDQWMSESGSSKSWDDADVTVLHQKAIRLNVKDREDAAFWLVNPSRPDTLHALIKDIPENEPIIVVNHRPDIVKQSAIDRADLVLAGHTHGGQVGVSFIRRLFPYAERSPYMAGLFKVRDTLLYVNRGVSSKNIFRFLCRPEVTIFEFSSTGTGRKPKVLGQDETG